MTVLAFTWGILMKTMEELTTMGIQLTFEVYITVSAVDFP